MLSIITTAYNASRYLEGYFTGVSKLSNLNQLQVFLILNQPDAIEREIVDRRRREFGDNLHIVELKTRETIGASLNRGLALAGTPYIGLLDVDDERVPDSFDRQIATLDHNSDVDFTYGDFLVVNNQGDHDGHYVTALDFDKSEFTKSCCASPTQVFRTKLVQQIGGFDEQLRVAADFDFQVRAAYGVQFEKTQGLLCYYTRAPFSSASRNDLQPVERTMIELRYGEYRKAVQLRDYPFVKAARRYRLDHVLIHGEWQPIQSLVYGYTEFMREREVSRLDFEAEYRRWLVWQLLAFPITTIRSWRAIARLVLRRMGMLDSVREWRDGKLTPIGREL